MKATTLVPISWDRSLVRGLLALSLTVLAPTSMRADLTHRYSFASDASDSVGGANGILQGNVTVSSGAANFPGLTNADYVELPPGLVSNYTSASFECWINVGVNGTWAE